MMNRLIAGGLEELVVLYKKLQALSYFRRRDAVIVGAVQGKVADLGAAK